LPFRGRGGEGREKGEAGREEGREERKAREEGRVDERGLTKYFEGLFESCAGSGR